MSRTHRAGGAEAPRRIPRIASRSLVALIVGGVLAVAQPAAAQGGGRAGRGGRGAGAESAGGPRAAQAAAGVRDSAMGSPDRVIAMTELPPVITHHTITMHGQTIAYTAYAGMLPIRNTTTGVTEGGIFFEAYVKDGQNPSTRPLSFIFNGGPGSSSVWLHLGAFGPKRVRLAPDGESGPPPYTYEDNPNTLLDQTDMVFIDPVGTGYSRAASPQLGEKFWGLNEDLQTVGEFVRLYLTRYDRWSSPKFLMGESYGTTRAAGLSGTLADAGIVVNGVVLISTVLDFEASSQAKGNDIGFVNFIPTYAATAWYHKKLAPDLQAMPVAKVAAMAEQWASGEYASALYQGARLPAADRQKVVDDMARLTGLSKDVIARSDLRVPLNEFDQELMRDQDQVVGRLDGRFTAYALIGTGGRGGGGVGDPSEVNIRNSFTPVLTSYLDNELDYKIDDLYYILGGGIGRWPFPVTNGYASVTPNLERAFAKNPWMKLYVAEGYYDAATPYYAVEWTLAHLNVSPEVRRNDITVGRFTAGHMVYIDQPSMTRFRADLTKFIDSAVQH
ncbi:MAG: S10 family peptidase [Gemmatimonadaceae bacterium]